MQAVLLVGCVLERLIAPDVFDPSEFITIRLDGDYIENDDDAFRIIARHLTSPTMRRAFLSI